MFDLIKIKESNENLFNDMLDYMSSMTDNVTIYGADTINQLKECIDNNEINKFIIVECNTENNEKFIVKYDTIQDKEHIYESIEKIGKVSSYEELNKLFESISKDPKKLNRTINIGMSINIPNIVESYDPNIKRLIKKYGQGIKNVYDAYIYDLTNSI